MNETTSTSTRTSGRPETSGPPKAVYRAVLVPLDGSDDAERAVGPGMWLSERFGADVHLVAAHVRRDERRWYEDYLDSVAQRTLRTAASCAGTHCTSEPDVARAVHDLASDLAPCLVCAATHGRSRTAAVLGSTFTSLAASSREPLVAIGPAAVPHTAPDPRRVVACIDGSPASEKVVPSAAAWARALGCTLSVVTATELEADEGPDEYLLRLARSAQLEDLAVDAVVLRGDAHPHVQLVRHLERQPASLLAVTTHARTGLARAMVGSEAARIIHASPIPVLVEPVPPPDAHRSRRH